MGRLSLIEVNLLKVAQLARTNFILVVVTEKHHHMENGGRE